MKKLQKGYYEGLRYNFNHSYGIFFAKEHLTPGQTDKIIKALTQRQMNEDDLQAALQDQGLPDDNPSSRQIKQQSQAAFRQAIEDAIGTDGYARFDAYDRQSDIYDLMSSYAAQSVLIGSPMTLDQVEQMVDYISQNNPDFQNGKDVNDEQIDWSAVGEQAQKIMTPEQYDLFTHVEPLDSKFSRTMQKVDRAINAIVTGSNQAPGAAPAR